MVLVCKKLYRQDFDPACFLDPSLDAANYPKKDYHKMFIGSIEKVLVKEVSFRVHDFQGGIV